MTTLKALAAGAAVAALAATAAFASSNIGPNGYVSGGVGNVNIDGGGVDDDTTFYQLLGAYSNDFQNGFGVQVGVDFTDGDDIEETLSGYAAARLRNENRQIGAGVLVTDTDSETGWGGFIEGDVFLGPWTLGGEAAVLTFDDTDTDVYGLGGQARYFFTKNFNGEVFGGLGSIDGNGADDDYYTLGAQTQYRFDQSPFSVFGRASFTTFDDADVDATAVLVGGQLDFGTADLLSRDRIGASFDVVRSISGSLF